MLNEIKTWRIEQTSQSPPKMQKEKKPILSKLNEGFTKQTGDAFLRISAIPPTAGTMIQVDLKNMDNKTKIITSVRSDAWVAYHNLIPILVLYPSILIAFSLILLGMVSQ